MRTSQHPLPNAWLVVTLALVAGAVPCGASRAHADGTIRIWKVGSPHTGTVPASTLPRNLAQAARALGIRLILETFPADGFSATFADAVARNDPPDVIAFDNVGVMEGITTARGTFQGIAQDPAIRRDLVKVTGAFDELLGPERGWTYLLTSSPGHQAARSLALRAPACPDGSRPELQGELPLLVSNLATAYLENDLNVVRSNSDSDRLVTVRSKSESVTAGAVQPCMVTGNHRLAFTQVAVSYRGDATIGRALVLLVLRKPASKWQLLAAARDPVSNGRFVREVPSLMAGLLNDDRTRVLAAPALLLSPDDGGFPRAHEGQRFGAFTWQPSPSADVVAEIAEFAYQDDARLILQAPPPAGQRQRLSAGQLWTTGGEWMWRVWSITRAGDVALSSVRTFAH